MEDEIMSGINKTHIFSCGKCHEGQIVVNHKFNGETNSVNIAKCSNGKCKHQYYFK